MRSDETENVEIGRRLKRARQQLGLGQVELASKLGVAQSTVSRIEKGQSPRGDLAERIAGLLQEIELTSDERTEEILQSLAGSRELRALVARILAER